MITTGSAIIAGLDSAMIVGPEDTTYRYASKGSIMDSQLKCE